MKRNAFVVAVLIATLSIGCLLGSWMPAPKAQPTYIVNTLPSLHPIGYTESDIQAYVVNLATLFPRSFERNTFFTEDGYNMTEWSVVFADESLYSVNLLGEQTIETTHTKVLNLVLEQLHRVHASYKVDKADGGNWVITYDNTLFTPLLP